MELEIKGIHCHDCAIKIEEAVASVPGVKAARVDFGTGKLVVERTDGGPSLPAIRHRVESFGYQLGEVAGPLVSIFEVEEMHCGDEVAILEKKLSPLPGVEGLAADIVSRRLRVKHHPAQTSRHELITAIGETGMTARTAGVGIPEQRLPSVWIRHRIIILTAASGCLTALGLLLSLLGHPSGTTVPMYLAAVVSGGYYIARRGFLAARQLHLDMNFLMTIAVLGAMLIGEWVEAATITFLFALAQVLESRSMDRARNAIRSLMDVAPPQAFVRRDGQEQMLPVEEIRLGDILIVKPGAKVPLDGRVVKGSSTINQAPITGESMPVEKWEGDEVFAGTINQQGALEVEVTHLAADSTLARIIHLVEEAQAQKAPSQRFVDQFAKYYTPAVIAGAVLIAAIPPLFVAQPFYTWFYRALVLLVIACPCALVISTPVTIVSGLAAAARRGVLIKGGRYLEGIGAVQAIAFDKTGTLTRGVPVVTDMIVCSPFTVHRSPNDPCSAVNRQPSTVNREQCEILRIAAAIEARSEHHLGQAIVQQARELQIQWPEVEEFLAQTGRGAQARIEGQSYFIGNHRFAEEVGFCSPEVETKLADLERAGKTTVILGTDTQAIGIIAIADQIREEVPEVLQSLKTVGVRKLVMLTGDNLGTAEAIAGRLGIDEYWADLLPADKVEQVRQLTGRYDTVAMVGDGVNDAPALAAASIGIAMGAAGTDQALETADVALMGDELSQLPFAVRLGRRAVQTIKQNISLSLAIKALFLALAIPGYATLWMAVGADMGASLLVVFNGLRLLREA
ncbi:MAG: heavy metal translocating P-type ATPase [candidate division NC10 bacterium]|nr:heavy metal translocating P-type ATPase [candidate division NC10 bacterium]